MKNIATVVNTLNIFSPLMPVLALVAAVLATIQMDVTSDALLAQRLRSARTAGLVFTGLWFFGLCGLMDRGDEEAHLIGILAILAASVYIFVRSRKALHDLRAVEA